MHITFPFLSTPTSIFGTIRRFQSNLSNSGAVASLRSIQSIQSIESIPYHSKNRHQKASKAIIHFRQHPPTECGAAAFGLLQSFAALGGRRSRGGLRSPFAIDTRNQATKGNIHFRKHPPTDCGAACPELVEWAAF